MYSAQVGVLLFANILCVHAALTAHDDKSEGEVKKQVVRSWASMEQTNAKAAEMGMEKAENWARGLRQRATLRHRLFPRIKQDAISVVLPQSKPLSKGDVEFRPGTISTRYYCQRSDEKDNDRYFHDRSDEHDAHFMLHKAGHLEGHVDLASREEGRVHLVSVLPCNSRREGGQSLVIGGSSLVILEGKGV